MYLGNIVSEEKIIKNKLFKYSNNLCDIDRNIPTLIIGWEFTKKLFYDKKISILNKKIDKFTFWTFNKKEKRVDFENDLKFFTKNVLKNVKNEVNYMYINILTSKYNFIKNLIKKLNSTDVFYIYIYKNSFVYLCSNENIFGFDLNMTDFLDIDRKKIYKILFSNGNKVFFNDDFLDKNIRENIENNNKIIPYLYKIQT